MYPELIQIPFIHVTVRTYGVMMVIGFLLAVYVIRRLSREITPDPNLITNAALYCLIAGVVGSRLLFVVLHLQQFQQHPLSVFAIWQGGLVLHGGVMFVIPVVVFYLLRHRLPVRHYLDILAIGLLVALIFGRIGCFVNADCFGKPTQLPWGIRFPYASFVYRSQVHPDPARNRPNPHLQLPEEFFTYGYTDSGPTKILKPYDQLTPQQKDMASNGPYPCLRVHPTQLYSSALAAVQALVLYLFWRRAQRHAKSAAAAPNKFLTKPGSTFALMFILYGVIRFFIEFLRDDNPFVYAWWAIYKGGTVQQNIAIYMFALGIILMLIFQQIKPKAVSPCS